MSKEGSGRSWFGRDQLKVAGGVIVMLNSLSPPQGPYTWAFFIAMYLLGGALLALGLRPPKAPELAKRASRDPLPRGREKQPPRPKPRW